MSSNSNNIIDQLTEKLSNTIYKILIFIFNRTSRHRNQYKSNQKHRPKTSNKVIFSREFFPISDRKSGH